MLYALKSQDTLINKFKGYEIEEEQAAKNRYCGIIINHDIDLIIPKYSSRSSGPFHW